VALAAAEEMAWTTSTSPVSASITKPLCAAYVEIALAAAYHSPGCGRRRARLAALPSSPTGNPLKRCLRLRSACRLWQELTVPYGAVKTRPLLAQAYQVVGNEDAAALELDTAQRVFDQLGASLDARRVTGLQVGPRRQTA
jgi:hypothetical protein